MTSPLIGVDADELLDLVAPELTRMAVSSSAGQISTESPRTRNLPRAGSTSLRSYWMSTSLPQHLVAIDGLADLQEDHHLEVVLGRAQAVDAGDAGDDDDVPAADQRRGRREAQAVDLVVDRGVLLDVDVLRRDVGLGLVVVVVADEVLHRVVGKELAELVVELGGQRLVVRDDQRGLLHALDDVGHRERLARAGHAEQRLEAVTADHALAEGVDRRGLVAGEAVVGLDRELSHQPSMLPIRTHVRKRRRSAVRGAPSPLSAARAPHPDGRRTPPGTRGEPPGPSPRRLASRGTGCP